MNALKRTVRIGIATFSGFFYRKLPRRREELLRHVTPPNFLVVDGIVTSDAFALRRNESRLSWRIRRGILALDTELLPYAEYHTYTFQRKKANLRITPGLAALRASLLWQQGVFPSHDPEEPYDKKRERINPYALYHYASAEPSPEHRVALATIATQNLLLRPTEEKLS